MILFLVALFLFGLPFSMLNQNRYRYIEDEQIVNESLYMWLEDVIINQYLLALGEFATLDAYSEGSVNDKDIIYLMFVCATFFTQVTILNMLIAIMSDVFERESDLSSTKETKIKLQILADNAAVLA